jgi:hypothetical protein
MPRNTELKADGTGEGCSSLHRPASTPTRLILDVHTTRCCCGDSKLAEVLDPEVASTPPPELAKAGVRASEWREWMARFQQIVYSGSYAVFTHIFAWMTLLGGFYLLYRNNQMQQRLATFMRDLNTQVLEPRGLYAKTQKGIFHANNQHEEISWMAIALTREEAESLREEDHVFWYHHWDQTLSSASSSCCTSCYSSCCGTPQIV